MHPIHECSNRKQPVEWKVDSSEKVITSVRDIVSCNEQLLAPLIGTLTPLEGVPLIGTLTPLEGVPCVCCTCIRHQTVELLADRMVHGRWGLSKSKTTLFRCSGRELGE